MGNKVGVFQKGGTEVVGGWNKGTEGSNKWGMAGRQSLRQAGSHLHHHNHGEPVNKGAGGNAAIGSPSTHLNVAGTARGRAGECQGVKRVGNRYTTIRRCGGRNVPTCKMGKGVRKEGAGTGGGMLKANTGWEGRL